ncbi:hypothetical protein HanRHA438_Chr08g0346331 [Helianthus annuus]|nr:hypothetical protein HanHA89_Chr08g0294011 [Helianthus annuus]KAJ0897491.1 hypothetical protein HanRHA438_Chr08g0346331 [Helianthus annuus]
MCIPPPPPPPPVVSLWRLSNNRGCLSFLYLGIRGIDIIPNLEFWASLPHRVRNSFTSLVRRFRGPSQNYRSSYSPVDF